MKVIEGAEALFKYANEGIIIANHLGEIVEANPSAEKLFGYDVDELIGKKIEVLIPKKLTEKHRQHRENYNQNPHPRSMGIGMDLNGLKKNGEEFPIEISLSPYSINDKKFIIAFIIDITVRKLNENELQSKKEKLQQLSIDLQKLNTTLEKKVKDRTMILEEAIEELNKTKTELNESLQKEKELNDLKSRFVSMASHEFRTPLATILSSLALVSKYGELDDKEKQHKHISRIKTAVNGLTDIINDVLSISRLEEGKVIIAPEEFNIENFVRSILQDLEQIVKPEQQLDYHHQGEKIVCLDKKVMKHFLFNLVSNAIKFSPEHKTIYIKTASTNDEFILHVKDQGIGISKEDQEHLFERFFRGQNAGNIQGTGLGLNIVGKYVELLNGHIEVISELEKGTDFIIKLPLK